ncbi:hypothetical protein M1L60_03250 [Actinoplanes sp. TRM 88003]|uniref:Uncharacterized protein n=1 Tax=Paractinoplanes aksuensis TaxID=2939490 RepID=A0ABT1DFJ4_9ACTN|nr:hypothetical protein [Actinoplanes aksuensis]MCO8269604.1 hypothetical protein [Actinoplanes aksuensis]
MTDHHHDFGDHDDFPHFEEPLAEPYEPPPFDDHHELYDTDDDHGAAAPPLEHHDDGAYSETVVDDHPAELTDVAAVEDPLDVFPPAVDVGELPEPVDGFPWIDTGSLGVVPAAALDETPEAVRPEELAEYAGVDLGEAQDPWAALAESDDPATSTLAKWWSEN